MEDILRAFSDCFFSPPVSEACASDGFSGSLPRRGAKWKPEGGGEGAEVNIRKMLKRTDWKLLLCHSPRFLSFFSFLVCNCGPVQRTYFIEPLDLKWAVTLQIVSSRLLPIAVNSPLDSGALFLLQQLSQQHVSYRLKVRWKDYRFWNQTVVGPNCGSAMDWWWHPGQVTPNLRAPVLSIKWSEQKWIHRSLKITWSNNVIYKNMVYKRISTGC